MKDKQLLNIINKIRENSYSKNDLNSLANYCISLSVHYLNRKHTSFFSSSNNQLEKIMDVAVDAVAPLFIPSNDKNALLSIQSSLLKWNKPINDEADADFFINRIVWNRTEQTIISIHKQNDPFFTKIYKTLSTCISENNFRKISFLGTNYIVCDSVVRLTGKLIQKEKFDGLPDSLFFKKQNVLITGLLDYIEQDEKCFPAIPFNLLVKRIKSISFRDFNESTVDERPELDFILSLKPSICKSLENVKIKLDEYYFQKKLSSNEYECMVSAFNNISNDLMDGGNLDSLYEYLLIEMPELTQKLFYDKYHRTMSYVYNIFRSHIIKQLEN